MPPTDGAEKSKRRENVPLEEYKETCPHCGGRGLVVCPDCGGTGDPQLVPVGCWPVHSV